jgi:UPF0176 protein
MYEIILYYKYIPIEDAESLVKRERKLCELLGLKGRLIIAKEGINGTLEGTREAIAEYKKALVSDSKFSDIGFKTSIGTGNAFPKLKVKLRDEIVSAHLGEADVKPWETTGKYLTAEELDVWINEGRDFAIVDMRNNYEFKIGHFEGSINPNLQNFRDLPKAISKLETLKEKPVLSVCTGGVRCEKASGYLIKQGFKNVYQLQNGIVTYMEKFPNKAFKGKLYVFDNRIAMDFDTLDNHTVVGKCDTCGDSTENYVNCRYRECNAHFLMCTKCVVERDGFCSPKCREKMLITQK